MRTISPPNGGMGRPGTGHVFGTTSWPGLLIGRNSCRLTTSSGIVRSLRVLVENPIKEGAQRAGRSAT